MFHNIKFNRKFKQVTPSSTKTYNNEVCSKSIETEAIFTKTVLNNEWNINFLQNSPPMAFKTYTEFSSETFILT